MKSSSTDDSPLQALEHQAVPGYQKGFLFVTAVMVIYLLVILISSPGKVEHHGYNKAHADSKSPTEQEH